MRVTDISALRIYGIVFRDLVIDFPDWVHRRVETLTFVDDATISRRVSVDYELSATKMGKRYLQLLDSGAVPLALLPFGFLAKRPLETFDLRDASGGPLNFLTQAETTPLAVAVLEGYASRLLRRSGDKLPDPSRVSSALRDEMKAVVECEPERARETFEQFGQGGASTMAVAKECEKLVADAGFRYLLWMLAHQFLAIAQLEALPSSRTMLKYSYVVSSEWTWSWSAGDLAIRAGLRAVSVPIELPLVHGSGSYHVELEAPANLELRSLELVKESADGSQDVLKSVDGRLLRAHLNIAGKRLWQNYKHFARVQLAPQRRGFIRGCLTISTFSVVAALIFWLFHYRIAVRDDLSTVATALILPGLLAAYISSSGEHPFASRLYFGLRSLLALTAGCMWGIAMVAALGISPQWSFRASGLLLIVVSAGWLTSLTAYVRATDWRTLLRPGAQ